MSSYTWDEPEPPGTRTVSSYTWNEGAGGYSDRSPLPNFRHGEPLDPVRSGDEEEWIAPAATGPAGAAIAVATLEAQAERDQRPDVSRELSDKPIVPEKSERRISPSASEKLVVIETPPSAAPEPPRMWEGVALPKSEGPDVIDEGAPKIIRHGTEVSISQLHVPGEFK